MRHLLKIGRCGVANHHLDDGGLQGHACLHEFCRAGVPARIGRTACACLVVRDGGQGLVGDISAAAHRLGNPTLGLHLGQHLAHGAAADLVLLAKLAFGGQAITGLPLATVQLVEQGGAKKVRGVHGVA